MGGAVESTVSAGRLCQFGKGRDGARAGVSGGKVGATLILGLRGRSLVVGC